MLSDIITTIKKKWKKIFGFLVALIVFQVTFVLLPYLIYPGSVGGNFGVRPKTHHCIGFTISNNTTLRFFPKADFTFNVLGKGYEYRVNKDRMLNNVCIGQDIWYGE